ncbi:MAG: hybrid sensor histidine kinase/response regulator transcription factor [Candidatus Halalkalibacterium sp. M3_1C_030]
MKVFSQDLSIRSFLTIGPYERDREFRELLKSIAQKGMVIYGLIGVIIVTFYVASHILLNNSAIVWDYSQFSGSGEILILDKILIFLFSSLMIALSRTKHSLKWIRIFIFFLVWFISIAMLIEDIAGQDTSFTMAYTTIALLFAAVMIPYTGWQIALLSVTVIISTIAALDILPILLGIPLDAPLTLELGQVIYISIVAILLTGTSSQIYLNRYEQFRARKQAEKLSEILEERAQILEMLKNKSEKQAQKIRENEKMKDRFFANISHEFRTPLTLILGPLQDMLENDGEEGKTEVPVELLQMMQNNGERLLDLINQLLDLSKIDASEITLKPQEVELAAFIKKAVRPFTPLAESQGVKLEVNIEESPLMAEVDPGYLERAIGNLVANAIKFTTRGGSVTVSLSKQNDPESPIRLSVKDDGIGIPKEDLSHIFDRFYQVSHKEGTFIRGTGIGLALVKEIVELHGGRIEVNSKPGQGSEFVLLLNDKLTQSAYDSGEDKPQLYSKQRHDAAVMEPSDLYRDGVQQTVPENAPLVLLVDDNADILNYLKPRLAERYNVLATESSKEALEVIKMKKVDLVISDVMMPDPDGFELCRLIKVNPELNHIPVILLTAQATEESRIEGLELGADDYISKPFSASELLVRVENLIDLRQLLRNKFSEEIRLKGTEVDVDSEGARFLKQVQSVIEKYMENSNFGVDWLADEVNLSTRQLQRKIRDITDLSAGGYIRMMRLERASQLISQEWGNVSEIAYKVGFQDSKYFSKLFKQTFGSTPTEYTENNA